MDKNLTTKEIVLMLLKGVQDKVAPFATGYFRDNNSAADNMFACENVLASIDKAIPIIEAMNGCEQEINYKPTLQGSMELTPLLSYDFENIETGDEIHFTSGAVWSCVPQTCGPVELGVYFVKGSFGDNKYGFAPIPSEKFEASSVKDLIIDAVKGGAKIVKGVGLNKTS